MMMKVTNPRTMTTMKKTRKIGNTRRSRNENTRMMMTEERMKITRTTKDTKINKRSGVTMTTTTTTMVTSRLMKRKKRKKNKRQEHKRRDDDDDDDDDVD